MINEEKLKQRISKNIKRLLEIKGKTGIDVAKALGVDKSTVSNWINAKRIPRMDYIDKLCDYFGCTRNDILSNDELVIDISKLSKDNQEKLMEYFNLLLNSQD